ncbi:transglycosylase [Prevotella sp. P3-120]|uniref:transglycosylase domain-containing protein n=1 Tax=unclassified Prevotella TaxID=2638335 RepID=UPI000B96CC79|nr:MULTISPECIES: transglycosylase domain-containing protein [unclassified Prevotella]OYP50502.1 transglycosylase [Prevotella sp. P3-120]OYP51152.1 transglycosylase [Prevotella sp. P3-92]
MKERIVEFTAKARQWLKKSWLWYKSLYQGRAWYVKGGVGFASLIIAFIFYLIMVDVNFLWLFGKSPSLRAIMHPKTIQASELYSADGVMIGKYFSENRTPVAYEEINPVFWKALIDTEDERFYHHFGIDFQGVFAAAKDFVVHHDARGASTITQQLVKNMFRVRTEYSTGLLGNIPGVKMLIMKSKEWITAVKIEMFFDKKDILTMYANTVDFGSNAYGIKTAAKTYFGTTPKELTPEQAAILVGLLKATTYYNPRTNPDNSFKRRNVVLDNMRRHKDLTREAYDTLSKKPIQLDYSVENNYDGQAQYFREAVADELHDWCKDNDIDLYRDGLKIYTTIDTRMQKYAEQAAKRQMRIIQRNFNNHWSGQNPWQDERHQEIPNFIEDLAKKLPYYKYLSQRYDNNTDSINYYLNLPHPVKLFDYDEGIIEKNISTLDSIRYMEHFMHCGFVAMEPETGHVKAWVGDLDFRTWKYDKVKSMRQPGSTFKLFVYAEAMNQGITPCDTREDSYFSMKVFDSKKNEEVLWAPTNANGRFSGANVTLKQAFAMSINSIAVKLGQECGIPNIVKTAHDMGIKSKLDATPALALGSSDVNLLELVNAYCTPVNDGKTHNPVLVTRIVDRDGKEIYTAPEEEKQVLTYKSAFLLQQLLQGGMQGTSSALGRWTNQFARDTDFGGKTGTSNNHSDAWFVGVSPHLVVGAWVGGEYRCIHFRTGALGQGSKTALPICGDFLEQVLGDPAFKMYRAKFDKPHDTDITMQMYSCGGYFKEPADSDSIASDSIQHIELEQPNENAVDPTVPVTPSPDGNQHGTPSQPKAAEEPKHTEI